MSQNTLIEKIKNDAAQAVKEIKAQNSTVVESIQREVENEIVSLSNTHQANLEKKKTHMELVAVSRAKQAGNIAIQAAKRNEINAIFDSVLEKLTEQSEDDYVNFFAKHVSLVVPREVEVETVLAPKSRIEETEKILKKTDLSGKVEADLSIKAGLLIKTNDGVYDVTLNRLVNEKRAELEMLIVNKVEA